MPLKLSNGGGEGEDRAGGITEDMQKRRMKE